jgi:raffinose/stachyose/melibiose transport system permease protein
VRATFGCTSESHGHRARRWSRSRRRQLVAAARYGALTVFATVTVGIPIWMVLVGSARSSADANEIALRLPRHWAIVQNYGTVLREGHMLRGLRNTLIVALPSVVGTLVIASFAAWVFARARSNFLRRLYYASIVGILLPPAIVVTLLVLKWAHLRGSFLGLIVFYMGVFMSFAIFFMTGFIKTIPIELEEAARIDGASQFRVFWKIILPLLQPALTTSFIVLLLIAWNDFFYPFFILNDTSKYTLSLGLYRFFSSFQYTIRWNLVFADVVVVSAPLIILYIVAQKRIVAGLMGGAVNK